MVEGGGKKGGKTSSRGDDRGRVPDSGMAVSGSRGFGVFLRVAMSGYLLCLFWPTKFAKGRERDFH